MSRDDVLNKLKTEIEALASDTLTDYDEEIFTTGFLDSLNVLNIIVFIEQQFNIKIDTFDVTIDTLGSLNKISDYVMKKVDE